MFNFRTLLGETFEIFSFSSQELPHPILSVVFLGPLSNTTIEVKLEADVTGHCPLTFRTQ